MARHQTKIFWKMFSESAIFRCVLVGDSLEGMVFRGLFSDPVLLKGQTSKINNVLTNEIADYRWFCDGFSFSLNIL